MAELINERKLLFALDYYGNRNFYDYIFNITDKNQYHKKINDIMYTNFAYDDAYISAAADFARRMVQPNRQNPNIDFTLFCYYFVFAFTEFPNNIQTVPNYIQLIKKRNNRRAINNNEFLNLKRRYDQFCIDAASLANNFTPAGQPQIRNAIINIQNMANSNNKIKFKTTSSAVYHWRKHHSELTAQEYLNEANTTVSEGYCLPNTHFHFLRLINQRNVNNEIEYGFAIVSEYEPIELVSYYIKTVNLF